MTIAEIAEAAKACQDAQDAELLLRSLRGQMWTIPPGMPGFRLDAHAAIGYATVYMEPKDAERVYDLFKTEHMAIPRDKRLSMTELLLRGWRTQAAYADRQSRKIVQEMLKPARLQGDTGVFEYSHGIGKGADWEVSYSAYFL